MATISSRQCWRGWTGYRIRPRRVRSLRQALLVVLPHTKIPREKRESKVDARDLFVTIERLERMKGPEETRLAWMRRDGTRDVA